VKRVLVIQGQMKQYRVPFFVKLHEALLGDGIVLKVAYGADSSSGRRGDGADLPEEIALKVKSLRIPTTRLIYHPILGEVAASDLVIAEQANRYLVNYLLLVLANLGLKRVAFWGLGKNKDEGRSEFSEWLRERIAKRVDWWFAYTKGTRDYLTSNGVSAEKITIIQNSIDTEDFCRQLDAIGADEIAGARRHFGIEDGNPVGLFVGALLPDKGLRFLLESARLIKTRMPGFHLFIVGGGQEQDAVGAACQSLPWVHFVGPRFGQEKALFFKLSDLFLLPGRVGLAILDAFAAGLPLVTTDISYHGPEVEYLESGCNGLISGQDPAEFSDRVLRLLSDPDLLRKMKNRARESSSRYSIEVMVENFRTGICGALSATKLRSAASTRA